MSQKETDYFITYVRTRLAIWKRQRPSKLNLDSFPNPFTNIKKIYLNII